jgi:hypothetical protein
MPPEPLPREEIAVLLFYDLHGVAEGFRAASPIKETGALGSLLFMFIKHFPDVSQSQWKW